MAGSAKMAPGPSRPVEDAVAAKSKARATPTSKRTDLATSPAASKAGPAANTVPAAKAEMTPGSDTRDRIIAAAREDANRRAALYANQLGEVSTLAELVAVGRTIHEVETEQGSTVVLTQLLAGSVSSPTLAEAILDGMTPWTSLVEDALRRVVAGTALATLVPLDDLAFAISSLFLGMELMAGLDTDHHRAAGLFTSLDSASVLVDALLRATS